MHEIIKGDPVVLEELSKLATGPNAIRHTNDFFGNAFHWYSLNVPEMILDAAKIMRKAEARLAIIAAYNNNNQQDLKRMRNACYEFVLGGTVYGCTVHLDDEHDSVPSITTLFANADWHEREMMELFGIRVTNHPNPRRLFLDEKLDKGLLGEIVPLSVMMNGASSSELWERILSDKEAK